MKDGPHSPSFFPLPLKGNISFDGLLNREISDELQRAVPLCPRGDTVCWGIPFEIDRPLFLQDETVSEAPPGFKAGWLVFLHTSDVEPIGWNDQGFISPMRGEGILGEHLADYIISYADGSESRHEVRRRHQIGMFGRRWGENCFQSVAHTKPFPVRQVQEQASMLVDMPNLNWGQAETRNRAGDQAGWVNWLWAWENPHPEKEITSLRFEPRSGRIIVSAISGGTAVSQPLRWETRKKAILKLPSGVHFDPRLDPHGLLSQVQLDLGQVISAEPRKIYPGAWDDSYNNKIPESSENEILIEYSAHPGARFHLADGSTVPVSQLSETNAPGLLTPVAPALKRVQIRVIEEAGGTPVPVKLHIHGESGEYLVPTDRHRQPNTSWFGDYAPEFQHGGIHYCTYIPGETVVHLPLGHVYIEISKGFEIQPLRKTFTITPETERIEIKLQKVLPWRQKGWVTADTHVHFLSPSTAQLEGSAEGVNVINLLASQWGELMTNVGDFDGKTTYGSREAGGDGEWLVRVGTENRQHVMGHISLLGYRGSMITPMCVGGPDEAAMGDPVSILLMEWAEKCRSQGGLVILPHFPNPRCENAADLISGSIDAVEFTSWGDHYSGIDPYSLSDWYRYLNCGYFVPAVGGTDKMAATTAVGTIRTYARIPGDEEFTYDSWMKAVRSGDTFVSYGPLMEFSVEGLPAGRRFSMNRTGGTVEVSWELASVTIPMSRVDLVVNGEITQSQRVKPDQDSGHWSVPVRRCSWAALLVRGSYPDQQEMIAAHSSPVIVDVEGTECFSSPDAVTMLEQIEGALAYVDTVGSRADDETYKRLRLRLVSTYRELHNRLHQHGHYHEHSAVTEH